MRRSTGPVYGAPGAEIPASAPVRAAYGADVAEVIPVFPLSHVLLPGLPLPLHIFEPRYRQLLDDIRGPSGLGSFGVVALRHGGEVGDSPRPDVAEVGTVAEIIELEPRVDGSADLLTVGSRRFRVREMLDAAPYPRARVDWMPEADGELHPAQVLVCRRLVADLWAVLEEITGRRRDPDRDSELPHDATLLSYHLAGHVPLASPDRQALLAAETTADRLRRAVPILRREIQLLQRTSTVAISPSVLRLAVHPN